MRTSDIIEVGYHADGVRGPDHMYIVKLWDKNSLIETRELPGKSIHYAESLAINWIEGIGEFKNDENKTV